MEYKNILIIKMSSLGDVLHTLPFAAVLRKRFPKAKLTWLVHPQFAGFVPDPPLIDEILYFDKVKFKELGWGEKIKYFRQMRTMLQSRQFDLVLDMQGLFKSAVLAALTGCPTRLGYCEMREGSGLISRAIVGAHAGDHVIERYLDVARYLGAQVETIEFPLPDLTREEEQVRLKLGAPDPRPYVVLVPGARWVTKRWPAANFSALARLLLQSGVSVVLAGGKDDLPLGREVEAAVETSTEGPASSAACPRLINLIGQTSLRELGALINGAQFYISGDTGPLFIATAFKKPLIALYGPTRPDRTGPYGSDQATVLLTPAPCAGCLKKQCDDWHCMLDLTPEMVFEIYRKKLEERGGKKNGTES